MTVIRLFDVPAMGNVLLSHKDSSFGGFRLCLIPILLLMASFVMHCQAQVVSQTSHVLAVSASWDKGNDPSRAHFVTGNDKVQDFFIKNYKLNMTRIKRTHESFVKLLFTVRPDGSLDSISFLAHGDHLDDVEALRLLSLTSGAWRPGQVDSKKVDDHIVIWFYFSDNAGFKDIGKQMNKAFEAFERNSWETCIKICDQVISYNPFVDAAHRIKIKSLEALGMQAGARAALDLAMSYYLVAVEQ